MNRRDSALPCITTTLRVALRERFKYPSKPPLFKKKEKNIEDQDVTPFDDLIEKLLTQLETAAYNSLYLPYKNNLTKDIDAKLFRSYISILAQFLVHISPSFYIGRHSFTFRDLLLNDNLPEDVINSNVETLWPEIYNQGYLTKTEYRMLLDMREVEVAIASRGLLTLIESCCGSIDLTSNKKSNVTAKGIKKPNRCNAQQIMEAIHTGGIFEEGSSFSQAQQYVCFAEGEGCWKAPVNKIIVPCHSTSDVCQTIPEENRIQAYAKNDEQYFGLCVEYEDFLYAFAKNDKRGLVADPFGKGVHMNKNVSEQIRVRWSKEIKMMRLYLDLNFVE